MNPKLRDLIDWLLTYLCDTEDCECEVGDEGNCALCLAQRAQELLEKEPR